MRARKERTTGMSREDQCAAIKNLDVYATAVLQIHVATLPVS